MRGGQIRELATGGMVIGVDPEQRYGILAMEAGPARVIAVVQQSGQGAVAGVDTGSVK